jgi:diguanylate cyclase (GGDEF)-like protein/PAS domain S-box-containing protein
MPDATDRDKSDSARSLRVPVAELTLGLIFLAAALGAMAMTRVNAGIALIWPANAIVAALLIRSSKNHWAATGLVLLAANTFANVLIAHRPWLMSILFSAVNCLEMGLSVWTFRKLVRFPYPDITIEQAAIMTGVLGIAIPGLSAIAGGWVLHSTLGGPLWQGILQWWSSHLIGACLFAPPVILFSFESLKRLVSDKFIMQNLATLLLVILGCYLAIHYVRFPFIAIGVLLMIAAFRVGGFGASVLSVLSGCTIAAMWSFGVRPEGLENLPLSASLASLPVLALLATTMPPIAVGLGTDARRAAARRLSMSERRFRESMENSPIGMLIADLNGIWGYTNRALQSMLGYSSEEFRSLPPGGPSEPDEWTLSRPRWQRLLSGEIGYYNIERRFRHKAGHWVWTHVAVSLLRDDDGSPQHLIAQIESLEARRQAEAALADERERLRITLGSIADAVITADAETRITYINAAGEALLGQTLADLKYRRLDEVISLTDPRTSKAAANLVGQSILHVKALRRETPCVLHRPDGITCYVRDVVSPVLGSQGRVTGIVVVFQEAGADVARVKDLDHRANHDTLTGLANRFEFQRRLKESFDRARTLDLSAALLAIDLDKFKAVNDSGGHAAGDAVLRRVAEVLRNAVRHPDVVARLGGDEFAVILPNCPPDRILAVGEQIARALNPLSTPWQGSDFVTGASVGLAELDRSFSSETQWLAAADDACYRAKSRGRGQLQRALL